MPSCSLSGFSSDMTSLYSVVMKVFTVNGGAAACAPALELDVKPEAALEVAAVAQRGPGLPVRRDAEGDSTESRRCKGAAGADSMESVRRCRCAGSAGADSTDSVRRCCAALPLPGRRILRSTGWHEMGFNRGPVLVP